jgi:N-formylmaleamate deformylase
VLKEAQIRQPHRPLNTLKLINKARHQTSTIPFQILKPPSPDYKQLVREIDTQSLLVIADDGIVSTSVAKELQSLNQKLRVEIITEAGHGLHYDQPEKFVDVVKSFLHCVL